MSDPGLWDKVEVMAKVYGPMALILMYMFYKDWQDRKERITKDKQLQAELAKVNSMVTRTLVQMVSEYNTAIKQANVDRHDLARIMRDLRDVLKSVAAKAQTEIIQAVQSVDSALEREHDKLHKVNIDVNQAGSTSDLYPTIQEHK